VIDVEITPEPEPDEAAALIAVLEQVLADAGAYDAPPAYTSRWRQAGLPEPEA
jgi:hypothetical protein